MCKQTDVPGTIYLVCFSRPLAHAKHYCGWTTDLESRLEAHAKGQGARLTACAARRGITWTLARTWQGTRRRERQIKIQGGLSRVCPLCRAKKKAARAAGVTAA